MVYSTKLEACHAWVNEFNSIPQSALEKINHLDGSVHEITPPAVHNRVYATTPERKWEEGEILDRTGDKYIVQFDSGDTEIVEEDDITVIRDSEFPMWGTLWSMGERIDEEWITGEYCEPHLNEMADCGFRIYESEDFGIVFGIDGAGYDFFGTDEDPSHWINLYNARGMHWHKEAS